MANSKREWLKAIILIVFSISLTFLILELSFRVFHPINFQSFISHSTKNWTDNDIFLNARVVRPSRTLGYEWIPNAKLRWVQINSLGMLDENDKNINLKGHIE